MLFRISCSPIKKHVLFVIIIKQNEAAKELSVDSTWHEIQEAVFLITVMNVYSLTLGIVRIFKLRIVTAQLEK